MIKPVWVKALEGYCIWVKFSDGVEGEVDLSSLRKRGAFSAVGTTDQISRTHGFQIQAITSRLATWIFVLTRYTKKSQA